MTVSTPRTGLSRSAFMSTFMVVGMLILAPTNARADGIETAGDIMRVAMPALAGGFSLFKDDDEGILLLAKSLFVSSALTLGTQQAISSTPPNGLGDNSFPSGHTANAFTAAAYMDHRYGWKYGLPSYLAAGFVAYSRVHADKHDIKDVVGGALISWTVSHLFVTPLPININGDVGPDRALLRISARW